MNFFRIALRKTWRCLFFVNGILTFMVFFPVFYVLLQNEKWFGKVFKLKRVWAKFLINNVGIRHRIIRDCKLDPNKAYVICPNHGSYLDIILTYISIPVYFHFIWYYNILKIILSIQVAHCKQKNRARKSRFQLPLFTDMPPFRDMSFKRANNGARSTGFVNPSECIIRIF